jgi:hypothetical protein
MNFIDVEPLQGPEADTANLLYLPGGKPLAISDEDMARVMEMLGDNVVGRVLTFSACEDNYHIRIQVCPS